MLNVTLTSGLDFKIFCTLEKHILANQKSIKIIGLERVFFTKKLKLKDWKACQILLPLVVECKIFCTLENHILANPKSIKIRSRVETGNHKIVNLKVNNTFFFVTNISTFRINYNQLIWILDYRCVMFQLHKLKYFRILSVKLPSWLIFKIFCTL